MTHFKSQLFRRAMLCIVPIWINFMPSGVDADEYDVVAPSALFHCGTPPRSRAEVVAGPNLGLDSSGRRVVRRNVTFPRYPCADAPGPSNAHVGAIDVLVDVAPRESDRGGRGWPPRPPDRRR